ncbi:MAG: hypothetical protein HC851_15785 [Acaryochloris sp. RU_4_1]|nr:hypothetical protein [Acaryochloris sp. RU_4_1]NJR57138.1 hypothetical protein [Acaryochloris sp. CRU_2_0]
MTYPTCDRCQNFSGFLAPGFLVCAIHPFGPNQNPCPDFAEVIEDWQPVGGAYYNGELIRDWPEFLTTVERLEILETHPFFTGKCPRCGASFGDARPIHYDCGACGWRDDSIN